MDLLRQIVGGPKNRFKENGYNLDLTYITDRVIAMAFPASGLEKLYRNSIDEIADFLQQRHSNNSLIINISGRNIDTEKLQNVEAYEWEDHMAPSVDTLFTITSRMDQFLRQTPENVVVVHCNHGKGRTGTIICCFLLYVGLFANPDDVMLYYARKRFQQQGFGVTQPCQIRYIRYFWQLLTGPRRSPNIIALEKVVLQGSVKISTPYVKVKNIRNESLIATSKSSVNLIENIYYENSKEVLIKLSTLNYFSGDAILFINNQSFIGDKKVARICFNTAFLEEDKLNEISPDSLPKTGTFEPSFKIVMYFKSFCECPKLMSLNVRCGKCREKLGGVQNQAWERLYKILQHYEVRTFQQARKIMFNGADDLKDVLGRKE